MIARRRGLGVLSPSSVDVVLLEELEMEVPIVVPVVPEPKGGELGGSSVGGVLDVCGCRSVGDGADCRLRGGPMDKKIGTVEIIASCSCWRNSGHSSLLISFLRIV